MARDSCLAVDDVKKQEEEKAITSTAEAGGVDWLELPENLYSHILSKLSCITDFTGFGALCVQWRSIQTEEDYTKLLPRQIPFLMIPTPPLLQSQAKKSKKKNNNTNSCSFYRVTDGKIFNRLRLTMPRDRYIRGSGHGWFITVDQDEICYSVQLMNPFFYPNTSTKEIKLPPLTAHPSNHKKPVNHYMHLVKAVLSADPVSNPKDFMVMAIFGEYSRLSFYKSGDKAWTPIRDNVKGLFDDVIYYKGKFYAIHYEGTIVVCNVAKCMTTTFAGPPVTEFKSNKKYLVISSGQLLQVHRHIDDMSGGITDGFKVFKLRKGGPNTDWVEVKDLYGHVLFLGDNASMSISASDFPGCKPNSIYYTDDNIEFYWSEDAGYGPHDLGVFNLENGSFEKHYPTDVNIQIWPAPIWIEPTLPRIINSSKYDIKPEDIGGSGHGWLITVDQDGICYPVQLINPFFYPNTSTSTKEIKLPPLTAHPSNNRERVSHYIHLRKAVLSADPISNPKDFIVMAIFGKYTRLSFCKSGDEAWTPIRDNMEGCFDDVIYYKGKFYAVHCQGTVVVCNVAKCMTTTFAGPPVTEFKSNKKYLVISSGQLLQVYRNVDDDGITIGFKVFKLQNGWPKTEWVEVNDLSGNVLCLGDNASISISASDYSGCKPNSIYYTDDNIELYWSKDAGNGPHDLGVFNLENGSFEKHYPTGVNVQIWPAPIWIEPTLQRSTTRTDQ